MTRAFKAMAGYAFICLSLTYVFIILVDQPLSSWIAGEGVSSIGFFHAIVKLPGLLVALAAFIYLGALMRLLKGRPLASQHPVLNFAHVIALAFFFKVQLKWLFGRTWPETWQCANPSWVQDGVFGFNWFQGSEVAYQSFPSGSMMVTAAAMTYLALRFPAFRMLAYLTHILVAISLILTNFHFASDVMAGWCAGNITAMALILQTSVDKPARAG